MMTTTWPYRTTTRTITTTRNTGESDSDWVDRHIKLVAADLAQFPINPGESISTTWTT